MKFCSRCNIQYGDEAKFCERCGGALAASAAPAKKNKPAKKKTLIIVAIALVIAILAALFIFTNLFGNHTFVITKMTLYMDNNKMWVQDRTFDDNGNVTSRTMRYFNESGDEYYQFVQEFTFTSGHEMIAASKYYRNNYGDEWIKEEVTEYRVVTENIDGEWYYNYYYQGTDDFYKTDVYDANLNYLRTLDEDGSIQSVEEADYDAKGRMVALRDIGYEKNGSTDWYEYYEIQYADDYAVMRCVDATDYYDGGYDDLIFYLEYETSMFW